MSNHVPDLPVGKELDRLFAKEIMGNEDLGRGYYSTVAWLDFTIQAADKMGLFNSYSLRKRTTDDGTSYWEVGESWRWESGNPEHPVVSGYTSVAKGSDPAQTICLACLRLKGDDGTFKRNSVIARIIEVMGDDADWSQSPSLHIVLEEK